MKSRIPGAVHLSTVSPAGHSHGEDVSLGDHGHGDHVRVHGPAGDGSPAQFAQQLERALRTLRDAGHRITSARKALLNVLIREHGPFTAEELHKRMPEGMCDPVTVYRSIGAMEESDLVRRCDFGDGTYRYEFNTGEHHHHHIICRQCGSVKTLDICFADGLERLVRQMGYANVTHTLEIFGNCVDCQTVALKQRELPHQLS